MTAKLTPAQTAVLTGDITYNANGSMAVETGRENTLASLRRMGLLNGNLLTVWGNDARVSLTNDRTAKVVIPENGEASTFYATSYTPNQPVSVYATVKGETEEFEAAHIPNGDPERVTHFLAWAQANPTWTNVRAVNYTMEPTATNEDLADWERDLLASDTPIVTAETAPNLFSIDDVIEATEPANTEGKWDAVLRTTSHAGLNHIAEYCTGCNTDHTPADCGYNPDNGSGLVSGSIDGTDEPQTPPVVTIDETNGRTVTVKVGEHSMTIRNGSDVCLRAAFWARSFGYRPVRGHALRWHREGKLRTAPVMLSA